MSNADTRTVEQVVMGLAEGMKPCPAVHSIQGGCGEHLCHGTGRVPEFPTLRKPCPVTYPTIVDGEVLKTHVESCEQCQGRGWLPVVTTDALLEAGKPHHIGVTWNGLTWESSYDNPEWPHQTFYKTAETRQLALALALEAAKQEAAHYLSPWPSKRR